VIPNRGRDKQLMPQFSIFLVTAVQAIFIVFVNRDILSHALIPTDWRVGGNVRSATNTFIVPDNRSIYNKGVRLCEASLNPKVRTSACVGVLWRFFDNPANIRTFGFLIV
jgi:hypothetical protein